MTRLENKIAEAQNAYYNGAPIMSDIEFDELWEKLKKEQPKSKLLTSIGADHTDGFAKVEHMMLMGSQNKVNKPEQLNDWYKKNCIEGDVIVQQKCDGISVELSYKNGALFQISTRGDGHIGDLLTDNGMKMKGVIKKLKSDFTGSVRGEILMFRADKEKYFSDKANCRNAASGVAKRKDGEGCEHLTVVTYDAQPLNMTEENSFKYQTALQEWLKEEGFMVAPWYLVKDFNATEIMNSLNNVFKNFDSLEFDIDGYVVKQNKIDIKDILTNYRPHTMVAAKPEYTMVSSTVRSIEWRLSNGTFTPIAHFGPVKLNGTTVESASLANISKMLELGIEIGHKVTVVKSGLIIPKIIKDETTGKFAEGYAF